MRYNSHWMKLLALLTLLFSVHAEARPEHFDLDMTSPEYEAYLDTRPFVGVQALDEPSIAQALAIGKRLSDWLATENARRSADHQLRLTSAATRAGSPIEKPMTYNPTIVQTKMDAALNALPAAMKTILLGTDAFPAAIPTDDVTFCKLGREVDKIYQTAARWKSLKPYLSYYTGVVAQDVRGYYYLNKNGWNADKLSRLNQETLSTQEEVKGWLKQECLNANKTDSLCSQELATAANLGTLADFYNQYHPYGKKNWDHFFVIPNNLARRDLVWNTLDPYTLNIPFNLPGDARIQSYLSTNIQDEWKFQNWQLKLNFGVYPNGPAVKFETGALPHVDRVGGNVITMDQNMSIDEYESQWTIRHEFGHVLGFPDCYIEFYDTQTQAFISYQLDITDLMCSRAGNFKERLYNELKRVYYHPF